MAAGCYRSGPFGRWKTGRAANAAVTHARWTRVAYVVTDVVGPPAITDFLLLLWEDGLVPYERRARSAVEVAFVENREDARPQGWPT